MDAGKRWAERDVRVLTLAFTAGVLLVHVLPELPALPHLFAALLLALLPWPGRPLLLATLAGIALSSAHAGHRLAEQWPDARHNEERLLSGTVVSLPEHSLMRRNGAAGTAADSTWRFTFAPSADAADVPPRIRASWYRAPLQPRAGECWQLRLRLRAPHGSLNPGGFDYEAWLFRQHLGATATVQEGRRCPDDGQEPVLQLRQRWVDRVDAVLGDRPGAALLKALTVGATADLRDDDWEAFRRTGTTHLVAISGFNLALAAGFAFFALRWLWALSWRASLACPAQRVAAVGAALFAVFYALLAGFEAPVARALWMLLVLLLISLLRRPPAPGHALAWAWLAIVAADPCAVLTPGLWLSFGAVAAIFYASAARWRREPPWRAAIRVQLLLSLVLAPLTAFYFHGVAWLAPLVNLLAVPLFALLTPLLLLVALVSGIDMTVATQLLPPLATLLEWLLDALRWLAEQAPMPWWPATAPLAALLLAVIGSLLLFAPAGVPLRLCGLLCFAPLAWPPQSPPPDGLELSVLDVGQGLSVLVRTAQHSLLFDAGPAFDEGFDAGASVVVPYVLGRGLRDIDLLLLSHPDNDHAGGVDAVRAALNVRRELGTARGEPCRDGMRWEWDGVRFAILHPQHAGGSRNDDSCVLRIDGPFSALLPGDIEKRAEARLLRAHGEALRADVLIAPHHGSHSSSTAAFVAAVRPQQVVFASGWRNRFRHPRPDVLRRYEDCGAGMTMTGGDGAIRIYRDRQGQLQVERWRERAARFWNAPLPLNPYWKREAAAGSAAACG